MCMSIPGCYVACVSMANPNQVIKALKEANEYSGPSIVIAYSVCISHGIKGGMTNSLELEKLAYESGYFPTFRYHPINGYNFDSKNVEYVTIITNKGTAKRVKINEFEKTTRAKRGLLVLREVKTNPYEVVKAFVIDSREYIGIKTNEIVTFKNTEIPIMDRYSIGSNISKKEIRKTVTNVGEEKE